MNIFILDIDQQKCAEYHNDRHVVKMILESAQMLSTVVRESGIEAGYKSTHKNHPCTKWVGESLTNWRWLKTLTEYLHLEWQYRFGHTKNHKSFDVVTALPEPAIPDVGLTEFAQAMPDEYKNSDVVKAYRNYYIGDKQHLANWKRERPYWYKLLTKERICD